MRIALLHHLDQSMNTQTVMHWLGFVPQWINAMPYAPFPDLVNKFYMGGGWNHNPQGPEKLDPATGEYLYPGDPPLHPFAKIERFTPDSTLFETVFAYPHELWLFLRPDGHYEMSRLD